jgi:hypothetical protein
VPDDPEEPEVPAEHDDPLDPDVPAVPDDPEDPVCELPEKIKAPKSGGDANDPLANVAGIVKYVVLSVGALDTV